MGVLSFIYANLKHLIMHYLYFTQNRYNVEKSRICTKCTYEFFSEIVIIYVQFVYIIIGEKTNSRMFDFMNVFVQFIHNDFK